MQNYSAKFNLVLNRMLHIFALILERTVYILAKTSPIKSENAIGENMFMSTQAYLSEYRLTIDDVVQHPRRTPIIHDQPGRMHLSLAYQEITPFDSL